MLALSPLLVALGTALLVPSHALASCCPSGSYSPSSSSLDCFPCGPHALTCLSSSLALTCSKGFVVKDGACVPRSKVVKCSVGQYLHSDGMGCYPCGRHAKTCQSKTLAISCEEGYEVEEGECVPIETTKTATATVTVYATVTVTASSNDADATETSFSGGGAGGKVIVPGGYATATIVEGGSTSYETFTVTDDSTETEISISSGFVTVTNTATTTASGGVVFLAFTTGTTETTTATTSTTATDSPPTPTDASTTTVVVTPVSTYTPSTDTTTTDPPTDGPDPSPTFTLVVLPPAA